MMTLQVTLLKILGTIKEASENEKFYFKGCNLFCSSFFS